MEKTLSVNWTKVSEHGKNTLKNSEDFENARVAFGKIVQSLDECWEGTDATAYKNSCNEFLDDLRKDTLYFESLAKYFDLGSKIYSTVEENNVTKLEELNRKLTDEQERDGVFQ